MNYELENRINGKKSEVDQAGYDLLKARKWLQRFIVTPVGETKFKSPTKQIDSFVPDEVKQMKKNRQAKEF